MSLAKVTRRALVGLGLAAAALLPAAAQANTLDAIKQRGKILIAIDVAHPPYGMLDDKAKETGSDVETARLLAKDLSVDLEIVQVSGANRIPFLLSGKADIVIASFSITEERKKVIDFSRPYGVVPVVLAAPVGEKVTAAADLDGKTVAVARGTTADMELTKFLKPVSGAKIVRYEDEATTNTAVATGQQSIFAAALSTANELAEQNPDKKLEVKMTLAAYPMAIGLRKKDDALREWVDGWVTANLKNGKLNEIYKKYFKMDLPAEMLD